MSKLIIESDDGTREEYINFFAVVAIDTGIESIDDEACNTPRGAIIHEEIGYNCRLLVAGAMLKKATLKAEIAWNEFINRHFSTPPLVRPDDEALNARIKWNSN